VHVLKNTPGSATWLVAALLLLSAEAVCQGTVGGSVSEEGAARVQALRLAASALQRHDAKGAETLLESLLAKSPNDPVALNLMGLVRVEQQAPAEAEKLFRQAIKESGNHIVGPHVNLAALYASQRPLDAIAELREALKLAPENAQARSLLCAVVKQSVTAAIQSGDKERAVAVAMKAREALPHDPELLYDFGLAALESGFYHDSQESLEEALRIQPDYSDAMYALARAYLEQSKAQQAEQQMRKYLAAKPNDATAQYGLGFIFLAEQKLDQAQAAFEQSLELQPNQTESVFELGEVALQRGRKEEARTRFQQVLSRDPRHAGALTELGALAYRDADYQTAKSDLERAIASRSNYQKAHYYYALTLRKAGEAAAADHEFETVRSLQKQHTADFRLEEAHH
jgi:tetratricopeptide (TPR) repeat protein